MKSACACTALASAARAVVNVRIGSNSAEEVHWLRVRFAPVNGNKPARVSSPHQVPHEQVENAGTRRRL